MSLALIGEQQRIVAWFVLKHRCANLRLIGLQMSLGILGIIVQDERQFDSLVGSYYDFDALPPLLGRGLAACNGQLQRNLGVSSNIVGNADLSLATLRCRDDGSTNSRQRQYARVLQHDVTLVRLVDSHLIGYGTVVGTTQTIDIKGNHCLFGYVARIAGTCNEATRLQGIGCPLIGKETMFVGTNSLYLTNTIVDDIEINRRVLYLIRRSSQLSAKRHLITFIIYFGIGIKSCCIRCLRLDDDFPRGIVSITQFADGLFLIDHHIEALLTY